MRRSAIRAEADELTYPVHIMLRYELEKQIFEGHAARAGPARGLATAFEQRLGVRPATDTEGCLQDVHWAIGSFGYFPSYALGSFIAAQLYESLRTDSLHFDREIAAGHFGGLFDWLRQNVHGRGASVGAQELIQDATGKPLTAAPWLRYAEAKYLGDDGGALDTLEAGGDEAVAATPLAAAAGPGASTSEPSATTS